MWWVPILASIAGGLASTGLASALAPDPQKPKMQPKGLDSLNGVGAQQPLEDPMQDTILQRYLAKMQQQNLGG